MKRVAIALFVLFQLAAALVVAGPALAQAVPVTDLIEERAVAELGATLPAKAKLDIRMDEGMIKKGNFVQEFWIDPDSGQFIANVVTDSGVPQRVWGLAMVTLTVPVPNRRIVPDEIVRAQDVSLVEMPMQRVGSYAINEYDQLVGQQVRRMLVTGRPVPRNSVMPPRIISRGEKVKIRLTHGGLQLTAKGRALDDAHKGQELRVVNLSSNKALSTIAMAAGVVEVVQ